MISPMFSPRQSAAITLPLRCLCRCYALMPPPLIITSPLRHMLLADMFYARRRARHMRHDVMRVAHAKYAVTAL